MRVSDRPVLTSRHLYLTELHYENLYTHFRWNNDPELNRLDSEVPFEPESLGAFKRRFETMVFAPLPSEHRFEVHLHDGALIGLASLTGVDAVHGRGHLCVTICERSLWGHGYGRDALHLLMRYGFDVLDLHRLLAGAFDFNQAWRTLLETAGFHEEGCLRDHLYRDGRYWSKHQFALLEDEYARRALAA